LLGTSESGLPEVFEHLPVVEGETYYDVLQFIVSVFIMTTLSYNQPTLTLVHIDVLKNQFGLSKLTQGSEPERLIRHLLLKYERPGHFRLAYHLSRNEDTTYLHN